MKLDVSALILAGGKATRFGGVAKHELIVDGETIFARQVRVLAPRVAEIMVSAPRIADILASAPRDIEGYRTVRDTVDGVGPLAGIAAGLAACRTEWLLVVAGDMPHITGELIDQLTDRGQTQLAQLAPVQPADRGQAPLAPLASQPADRGQAPLAPLASGDPPIAAAATGQAPLAPVASDDLSIDAVGIRVNGLPEPLLCLLHTRVLPHVEQRIAAGDYKASRLLTDGKLRVEWIEDADRAALRNVNSPEDLGS